MLNGIIHLLNNYGIPQQSIITVVFYLIAALTVFFAVCLVTSRNIFHAALYLAATLSGIAGVYLYLDAEFLAIAQIIIYVGAIVTLFLFVIMLTANIRDRAIKQMNQQVVLSAVVAAGFLYLMIKIIKSNAWHSAPPPTTQLNIANLGKSLMTTYVLPFEIISLILISVLIGAIVIAKVDNQ